jgi:hypothetical protein
MAPPASENVDAKFVKNGAVPQLSTQQTLQGSHTLAYGLSHFLSPNLLGIAGRMAIQEQYDGGGQFNL